MRVLLIGGGGREHALAWKVSKSRHLSQLFLWPGNALSNQYGTVVDLPRDANFAELKSKIIEFGIDAVICGPEQPLAEGLSDALQGIPVFGPNSSAAALESSKAFAKSVMADAGIPTADYKVVRSQEECKGVALEMLARTGGTVLKASGLAAGKGVFVCKTIMEVESAIATLFTLMKEASLEIVVEEILEGRECSYFTLIGRDGPTELCFAVDHKRLLDGDQGPNTGGMGCYAPVPWLPSDAGAQVEQKIVNPLLQELKKRNIEYIGCLYVGIMWGHSGPKVVEFNVRFGDPECEVLVFADDRDWLELILGKLGLVPYELAQPKLKASVCVVIASASYPFGEAPDDPQVLPATMFIPSENLIVFASSVTEHNLGIEPGKGRALIVTASGESFKEARKTAYSKILEIQKIWPASQIRRDIALAVE